MLEVVGKVKVWKTFPSGEASIRFHSVCHNMKHNKEASCHRKSHYTLVLQQHARHSEQRQHSPEERERNAAMQEPPAFCRVISLRCSGSGTSTVFAWITCNGCWDATEAEEPDTAIGSVKAPPVT